MYFLQASKFLIREELGVAHIAIVEMLQFVAYGSHGFYPFYLRVFQVKIVASLHLIYCCLVDFVVGSVVC